jgi:Ala-tRNA(Pro) deacylase
MKLDPAQPAPGRLQQPRRSKAPQAWKSMSKHRASRKDLFERLDALNIPTRTVEHEAVFTVEESERLERDLPGGHTKNLMLKDAKGQLFLITAQAHTRIELKSLHKTIGCARLSFAKPDVLLEVLGVTPGSVTAFSLINDTNKKVSVIIDQELMKYDIINCHPLENTATTAIARDDLMRFIQACGHEPVVLSLSAPEDG